MADTVDLNGTFGMRGWQQAQDDRTVRELKSPAANDQKKLRDSAHAFESLLIGKWLEAAEDSLATVPGGSEDGQTDGSMKQLSAIGVQSLAESVSKAGGFGIAKMLLAHMKSHASY